MQRFFDTFFPCVIVVVVGVDCAYALCVCLTGKTKIIANLHLHVRTCTNMSMFLGFNFQLTWGVFSAACRMTNQKKSVSNTHKYIYYETTFPPPPSLPLPTIAISVKRQSLFEFRGGDGVGGGGSLKSCRSQTSDKFRTIRTNYALQLLSQASTPL